MTNTKKNKVMNVAQIIKEFPFEFKILVEDDNEKTFNFWIKKEDIESILNLEPGILPETNADYDESMILNAAVMLLDAHLEDEDLYSSHLEAQKVVGYAFLKSNLLYDNVCKSQIDNPAQFVKENNYLNYRPVLG